MLISAVCLCLGQLVWKLMPGYNLIYLFCGFAIFAVGALSMIFAYRYGELSVLQPMNSMSYVFSTVLAMLILHESITVINMVGILLVISGVIIIGANNK